MISRRNSVLVILVVLLSQMSVAFAGDLETAQQYLSAGRYREAVAPLTRLIATNPEVHQLYLARGIAGQESGNYSAAAKDFATAVRMQPGNAEYQNALAWLKATCPDHRIRNGQAAVAAAAKACELSKYQDHRIVDTLAAAVAEVGEFNKAVQLQQIAVARCDPSERKDFQARLTAYRNGRAWNMHVVKTPPPTGGNGGQQNPPLRSRLCPICVGSGQKECIQCVGDGWVHNFNDLAFPDDPTVTGKSTCWRCNGRGKHLCNHCQGTGRLRSTR